MSAWDPAPVEPEADAEEQSFSTDAFEWEVAEEYRRLCVRQAARDRHLLQQRGQHPPPDVATLTELRDRPRGERWRIEGLLPAGGRLLLAAQRKTGKTTATGNLHRSLLTGEPFLGRFDVIPVDGTIVALNFEVTGDTYADWMTAIGVPGDRLVVVNLRGRRNLLADETGRQELVDIIRDHDAHIITVDPFGRAFTGRSQNDAAEVAPWLVRLDEVAETAGCSEVILTAHTGWDGERTRGSSALEDWPDAIVTLTRDPDTDVRFLKAEGRDVDVDEDQLHYEPTTRHLTMTGAGNRRSVRSATRLDELAAAVRDVVANDPGVTVAGIRAALRDGGHSIQKGDENRAAALAVDRGLVRREPGTRRSWLHYLPEASPKTPSRPDSPPGLLLTTPDPPLRTGVSHGVLETPLTPNPKHCPHGVEGGEQPDPFVNGRLSCTQCAAAVMTA